jgi:hypothetical protein
MGRRNDQRLTFVVTVGWQRPHEILFILLSAVLGVAYLIGAPPPQSVVAMISPSLVHVWAAGLTVGGLLGMIAVGGWGGQRRSLRIEQAAMLNTAVALCVAASTIMQSAGSRGSFGVGFSFAWAMANVARAWMIQADLRRIASD